MGPLPTCRRSRSWSGSPPARGPALRRPSRQGETERAGRNPEATTTALYTHRRRDRRGVGKGAESFTTPTPMSSVLPAPSFSISAIRRAHAASERGVRYADFLDRLVAREAERDPETGLTAVEEARERAYHVRMGFAEHASVGTV